MPRAEDGLSGHAEIAKQDRKPRAEVGPGSAVLDCVEIAEKHRVSTEPWGLHVFTTIYEQATGEPKGYQVVCRHPHHQKGEKNAKVCQKTRNWKIAGGKEACERELKTWLLYGLTCTSQQEHEKTWQDVLLAKKKTGLLSSHELNATAIEDWSVALAPFDMVLGGPHSKGAASSSDRA